MRYYFLITGVLLVLYYLILVWHSRKLRSTFAVFWLFTGGAHLIIGCAPFPAYMYIFLTAVCCAGWICFISVEIRIFSAMFSGCDRKVDCIIVLGAQVKGKKITDSLKRRLDRAAGYLQEYPDTRVIVSGGRGPGEEISEADAMADYLISSGISGKRISREDQSSSTRQNFRYSRKYIDSEHESVGIVTNGFHMYRAYMIAEQEGYQNIYKIPASSNPVFQLNYLMREFFAVVYAQMKMKPKRGK